MIIKSILDCDVYKFYMQDFVYSLYPTAVVKYQFICRNKDVKLGFLKDKVENEIYSLDDLRFQEGEIEYLRSQKVFHENYLSWLEKDFKLKTRENIVIYEKDGDLKIDIVGRWCEVILFEIYILAIVNELYFRQRHDFSYKVGQENLNEKIRLLNENPDLKLIEFGTRRRFSREWQDQYVVKWLKEKCNNLIGTSNVFLAKKYNIPVIGSQAHEIFSAHLSLVDNIAYAQKQTLYMWMAHFDNNTSLDLGIALTDTFTTQAFFSDFKHSAAIAYKGVRHDSGDPFEFGEKVIKHYESMGINPKEKFIVFSDGLNIPKSIKIHNYFGDRIKVKVFGVGTDLSNDLGCKALNIVIKLIECNGKPCVKISDNPSKAIGDAEMIKRVKIAYNIL